MVLQGPKPCLPLTMILNVTSLQGGRRGSCFLCHRRGPGAHRTWEPAQAAGGSRSSAWPDEWREVLVSQDWALPLPLHLHLHQLEAQDGQS